MPFVLLVAILGVLDVLVLASIVGRLSDATTYALLRTVKLVTWWAGVALLLLLIARSTSTGKLTPVTRRIVLVPMLSATLCFVLVKWGFTITTGAEPTRSAADFLRRDFLLVLLHGLQTIPSVVILIVGFAATTAWVIVRAEENRQAASSLKYKPRLREFAGVAVVYLISPSAVPPKFEWDLLSENHDSALFTSIAPRVDSVLRVLPTKNTTLSSNTPRIRRVVVVLVESLRYDLLEKHTDDTPFLSRLAKDGINLTRAYATSSHSNFSDISFWYSQYPLRPYPYRVYSKGAEWRGTSLFEAFTSAGFSTAYFSSQNEDWGGMSNWMRISSLNRFIDANDYSGTTWENLDDEAGLGGLIKRGILHAGKVEDSRTLEFASQWIRSLPRDSSFFVGINLQNTHFSYVRTPRSAAPHQPSTFDFPAIYYKWPRTKRTIVKNRFLNSVRNVDSLLSSFANGMMMSGLWDDMLFVVVGDNGEAFYEHGFGNHSGPMYEEVARTVAVLHPPANSFDSPQRLERVVSHVDIPATILHMAGLEAPDSFQGRSIFSDNCIDRPAFSFVDALAQQVAMVDGR